MSEYSLRYSKKNDKEYLDLVGYGISDNLKLKNFDNLFSLDCSSNEKIDDKSLQRMSHGSNNNITSLDLSECKNLREVNCSGNKRLTKLDISGCKYLKNINLVGCINLREFIFDNNIHSIDDLIRKTMMTFCKDFSCKKPVDGEKYCADHIDKYRTHACKDEKCNLLVHTSKEYCKHHIVPCSIDNCQNRIDKSQKYCEYHQNKIKLERLLVIKKSRLESNKSSMDFNNSELSSVANLAKSKLVSKSIFSDKKKKREEFYLSSFEKFLENQKNNNIEESKINRELLEKKVSNSELDSITKICSRISILEREKNLLEYECEEIIVSISNNDFLK